MLPPVEWIKQQRIETDPLVAHAARLGYPLTEEQLRGLVPLAFLFTAYLDRRTSYPILSDGRFYLQLLCACLAQGLASWSKVDRYGGYHEFGHNGPTFYEKCTGDVNLAPGIAFNASHERLQKMLSEQVDLFISMT